MQQAGVNKPAAHGGRARLLAQDLLAGSVAAVVLIANIVSFAALMFPGPLAQGTPIVIWAMLIGAGVGGLWVAWRTSLPPLASGMDSPTGAVLVLMAASTGPAVLAAGGNAQAAVLATMLMFSAATLLSGVLLLGLGLARWGAYLRFVPNFVVAGFLGATGWLLIVGGIRMVTGRSASELQAVWGTPGAAKLAAALAVLALLLALRRWVKSPLAMPAALVGMTLAAGTVLSWWGLADGQGWYLPSLGTLVPWSPLAALQQATVDATTVKAALLRLPELFAATVVALISLVSKTSSLELARKSYGDLDQELRVHGAAALAVAPLGGLAGMMQLGSSRLLDQAGGRTRLSGVAAAGVMIVVALTNLDLPALIPLPVAAGLVMVLGWGFLVEALARPLAQRAWLELLLALAIMVVCVRHGYLVGVIGGVIGACLLFAASYARIGVVRQHLSRAQFAGTVSRSAAASQHLGDAAAAGESIQIYWLSGYIFFGSSEGVFERVRRDLLALPPRRVSHVVLDFRGVTGADASATVSLAKLHHFCQQQGAALVVSALSPATQRVLARDGLLAHRDQPAPFAEVDDALAWCEDRVLAAAGLDAGMPEAAIAIGDARHAAAFEVWLQQQLGPGVNSAEFMHYLVRHAIPGAQPLYREGEPADEIDLVAAGRLVVTLGEGTPQVRRVRSLSTHTVVGEMGFFRRAARSATVSSEGPALLFTLTRANFERMRAERPDLANAFYECLLRMLADRIGLSERMVMSLGR